MLLDAVMEGLKRLPETRLEKLPRMADFALWITACETALWPAGTFWSAYCGNRDEAIESVIDADPIAAAARAVMMTQTVWTGTASDLLGALAQAAGERAVKSKTWPDTARAVAGRMRRAASFLRKVGIEVVFKKEGNTRRRIIEITSTQPLPRQKTPGRNRPHRPHRPRQRRNPTYNGSAAAPPRTAAHNAECSAPIVRANPLKSNGGNAADGADANFSTQSAQGKVRELGWRARL